MISKVLILISLLTAAASGCLGQASAQNISSLSTLLTSKKTEDRRNALQGLRSLGTTEAARVAVRGLTDKSSAVRATAAGALEMLPGDEAVEALAPLLKDGTELVRKEAVLAIGRTRTTQAVTEIRSRLKKEKSREVRAAMAIALGTNGDESGLPILAELLSAEPKEEDEFVRRSAARSIGQIAQLRRMGHADSVTPRDFLPNDKDSRRVRIAETMQSEQIAAILLRIVADSRESSDTLREAVYALGAIGTASFRKVIEPLTRSDDPYLARIALEALARLNSGDN